MSIKIFLENFHYLNNKGRRSGCLLFGNKGLTGELVSVAKQLRIDLLALNQNQELSWDAKNTEFFRLIRKSFTDAEILRAQYGKPVQRKTAPHNMFNATDDFKGRWVKPYKTGRFEKQLVAALDAVDNNINEAALKTANPGPLKEFKRLCQALADEIRNYKHPESVFAEVPNSRVRNARPEPVQPEPNTVNYVHK